MRFLDCSHGIKTSLLFFIPPMLAHKERGEPVGMLTEAWPSLTEVRGKREEGRKVRLCSSACHIEGLAY